MDLELNAHEARVLGVLVEKQMTTPDQYPLTLNAICNGSNQKSNRDPVVSFSEAEVTIALQGLRMKHVAGSVQPLGSRGEKWQHNGRQALSVTERELAVLAELLLRGPQQPGELRTRVSRMSRTNTLEELNATLRTLQEKDYIERLPPAPGARTERYSQRLAASLYPHGVEAPAAPASPDRATAGPPPARAAGLGPRVEALESEVAELRAQLQQLAGALGETLEE